ncbi:hypothetical protein D6C81_04942 [Aureobasidium pullulans]|nr:hypothetical protein D6C81_04942 [Aureobasidium pullulans]
MTRHAYMELARRDSVASEEAAFDHLSDTKLEQKSRHSAEAHTPRPNSHKVLQLLRSRARLLQNPLVVIILVLSTPCLSLSVWIAYLSEGLHRIPGDGLDDLFGLHITRESPSIWDDEHQSLIHKAYPVAVHSHNDYSQRIPLFQALGSGCISVEADVHLRNSDLLVGHHKSQLHPSKTLQTMYLDPLERIIRARNPNTITGDWRGIFELASNQTLVLLVDLKTEGTKTLAMLVSQLRPLRDLGYLTHWNGTARVMRPLTVVGTGNTPFLNENTYRDVFWDAELSQLVSEQDTDDYFIYNVSNSYYASTQWNKVLSRDAKTKSQSNVALQVERTKERGLLARYWDTPAQPPNMRELVWRRLIQNDVGVLNMDDMGIVRDRAQGWGRLIR